MMKLWIRKQEVTRCIWVKLPSALQEKASHVRSEAEAALETNAHDETYVIDPCEGKRIYSMDRQLWQGRSNKEGAKVTRLPYKNSQFSAMLN